MSILLAMKQFVKTMGSMIKKRAWSHKTIDVVDFEIVTKEKDEVSIKEEDEKNGVV